MMGAMATFSSAFSVSPASTNSMALLRRSTHSSLSAQRGDGAVVVSLGTWSLATL